MHVVLLLVTKWSSSCLLTHQLLRLRGGGLGVSAGIIIIIIIIIEEEEEDVLLVKIPLLLGYPMVLVVTMALTSNLNLLLCLLMAPPLVYIAFRLRHCSNLPPSGNSFLLLQYIFFILELSETHVWCYSLGTLKDFSSDRVKMSLSVHDEHKKD